MSIWSNPSQSFGSCKQTGPQLPVAELLSTSASSPTRIAFNPQGGIIGDGCWRMDTNGTCSFEFGGDAVVNEVTADISLKNCTNVWAAPLWMKPNQSTYHERAGTSKAEIDIVELCGAVSQNYDTWGWQTQWGKLDAAKTPPVPGAPLETSGFDAYRFHVYYDKDADAVKTWACPILPDGTEDGPRCLGGGNYQGFAHDTPLPSDRTYYLVTDVGNLAVSAYCGHDAKSSCSYQVDNVKLHTNNGSQAFASGVCTALNA